jgi:hypothetical protein
MPPSASTSNLCPYCHRSFKSVVQHLRKSELCRSAHGDSELSVTDRRNQHREKSQPREENASAGSNYQSQNVDDVYDFAVWDDHDQFLACTVDPMHMFEGGWIAMVCKAFCTML